MKKEFKVGDRVAAYGHGWAGTKPQSSTSGRVTGIITKIDDRSAVIIKPEKKFPLVEEGLDWIAYNNKQLRRLKPKQKALEFWILKSDSPYPTCYRNRPKWGGKFDDSMVIHVREVLEKKK